MLSVAPMAATRPVCTTNYFVVYCRTFFDPGVYLGLKDSAFSPKECSSAGHSKYRHGRSRDHRRRNQVNALFSPSKKVAKMARTTLFDWSFALFAYMGVAPPSIAGDSSLRAHSALSPNVLPNRARTLCACAPSYPLPLLRTRRSKASLDRSVCADLSELAGAAAGV